jgi:3-deoxy-D-manno-octulosonic-acid transferase
MIEEFGVIPNYVKEAKVIYYGGSFVGNPTKEHKGLHNFFEGLSFSKKINVGPFLYPLKEEVDELAVKGLVRVLKMPMESPIEAKMRSEDKQELKAYLEKRIKQRHDAIQWLQHQISL